MGSLRNLHLFEYILHFIAEFAFEHLEALEASARVVDGLHALSDNQKSEPPTFKRDSACSAYPLYGNCFPFFFFQASPYKPRTEPGTTDPVSMQIRLKNYSKAARELDRAEKNGRCKEAVCLVLHARIAEGTGERTQALAYARRAAARFGPESGLKAGDYNDIGVILYRHGPHDPETLKLAETVLRQADTVYKAVVHTSASNIRLNLATVLEAEGRTKESKEIMDVLNARGILIDPEMAILGDFQAPERQR